MFLSSKITPSTKRGNDKVIKALDVLDCELDVGKAIKLNKNEKETNKKKKKTS